MSLASGAHIRSNGIRQHYLRCPGAGTPVVIIPGIVSPAVLWSHIAQGLVPRHDVYVLDVRGRGLSEAGAHLDYSLDACGSDVAAFVRTMGLGPAILIGHSMGARIALRTARASPDVVSALVLADPPTSGPGRRPYPVPMARTLELLAAAQRGEAGLALRGGSAKPWPEDLMRLRAEWLSTCDPRAVHAAYADFHGQDMFADLAAAAAPVTLICAGEGGVVSDADVDEMRRLRPDLHAERLAGAGHQLQAEDPAGFRRLLDEALRRHDLPTTRSEG